MTNDKTTHNADAPQLDTRLRSYDEAVARLIRPVPRSLVDQRETGGGKNHKADYINITTMKDLLDAAVGLGNWREEIISRDYLPPKHFGIFLRVSILTSDRGWVSHENTGYEATDNKGPGDPFSNAYAQAFRRCCESFGMARELWRREVINAQTVARELVKGGAFDSIVKAPPDEEQAEHNAQTAAAATERDYQLDEERTPARPTPAPVGSSTSGSTPAARSTEKQSPATSSTSTADDPARAKAKAMLATLGETVKAASAGQGKAANAGQLQMIETRGNSLAKRLATIGLAFDVHNFVEESAGVAVHNLNFDAAKLIIDTLTAWLKAPEKGAQK
jgi:hypothetical protein